MTDDAPHILWVKPQQPRSKETLERLCVATEQLLDEKSFEQITIDEIARKAGSSVGGFYARFPDKEALYFYLYERYEAEFQATVEEMFKPDRWQGIPLAARIQAIGNLTLKVLRERRGFLRTLFIRTQSHLTPVVISASERRSELVKRFRDLLLECAEEMTHPDPELATMIGFYQLMMAIQSRVLFPDTPLVRSVDVPDEVLVHELTNAFLVYVGAVAGVSQIPSGQSNMSEGIS